MRCSLKHFEMIFSKEFCLRPNNKSITTSIKIGIRGMKHQGVEAQ